MSWYFGPPLSVKNIPSLLAVRRTSSLVMRPFAIARRSNRSIVVPVSMYGYREPLFVPCWLSVALTTGMRIAEIFGLAWNDSCTERN